MEQYRRGVFTDAEFRVVRPDGSVRWFRNRAFPIAGPTGAVAVVEVLFQGGATRSFVAVGDARGNWKVTGPAALRGGIASANNGPRFRRAAPEAQKRGVACARPIRTGTVRASRDRTG